MSRNLFSFAAVGASLVGAAALALGSLDTAVPLGTIELNGGTESTTVDSTAFAGSGGLATILTGTVENDTAHEMSDLTMSLKKKGTPGNPPSAGKGNVGDKSEDSQPTAEGQTVTVDGLAVPGNSTATFSIEGINANGTSEMTVNFTPSFTVTVDGAPVRSNLADGYSFSQTSNSMVRGVPEQWHSTVMADITNTDSLADVSAISGEVLLPQGSGLTLQTVRLQDVHDDYATVPGTVASVSGNTFELTGFTPLAPGDHYLLVVVLSAPVNGMRVQIDLTASFF